MTSEGDECVRGRRGPFDGRPATAPDFLLSRSHGSVRTQGSLATYSDPWLAAERLRRERLAELPGGRRAGAEAEVDRRAADWAQVFPEWGLARNAAIVIGPRRLTRGIDLERRAF